MLHLYAIKAAGSSKLSGAFTFNAPAKCRTISYVACQLNWTNLESACLQVGEPAN